MTWHDVRRVAIRNGLRKRGVRKSLPKSVSSPGKADRAVIRKAFKLPTQPTIYKWAKWGIHGLKNFEAKE